MLTIEGLTSHSKFTTVDLPTNGASHGNVTNAGFFSELHANCMATACVLDNTAALPCLMKLMQQCGAAVDVAQISH